MWQGILELNATCRSLLSNDLGAIGGLLFDFGSGGCSALPLEDDQTARKLWEADLHQVREQSAKEAWVFAVERETDRTHTEIQGWLRDLGHSLGYDVWIAANDRSRPWQDGKLGDDCLSVLSGVTTETQAAQSVRLIDVLWLDRESHRIVAAFEVEHSTTIYSCIVRMLDIALGLEAQALEGLFLVVPDKQEADVPEQSRRVGIQQDCRSEESPVSILWSVGERSCGNRAFWAASEAYSGSIPLAEGVELMKYNS